MNLKPNLWTVLFVLVAGAWFWTSTTNDSAATAPSPEIVSTPNSPVLGGEPDLEILNLLSQYEISPKQYKQGRATYVSFLQSCLQDQCLVVEYTGPSYYKIHRNEIDEFSKLDTGGYLYLIPIVEKIRTPDNICHTTLTFAFTKERPEKDGSIQDIGKNDKIYNFATPCPPLCGDELAVDVFCETTD